MPVETDVCQSKQGYANCADAQRHLKHLLARGGRLKGGMGKMMVYRCPVCGLYKIGHARPHR